MGFESKYMKKIDIDAQFTDATWELKQVILDIPIEFIGFIVKNVDS